MRRGAEIAFAVYAKLPVKVLPIVVPLTRSGNFLVACEEPHL
jgi:hypothetical protein